MFLYFLLLFRFIPLSYVFFFHLSYFLSLPFLLFLSLPLTGPCFFPSYFSMRLTLIPPLPPCSSPSFYLCFIFPAPLVICVVVSPSFLLFSPYSVLLVFSFSYPFFNFHLSFSSLPLSSLSFFFFIFHFHFILSSIFHSFLSSPLSTKTIPI